MKLDAGPDVELIFLEDFRKSVTTPQRVRALLGVFLLGTLTKRATENGAIVGMAVGLALNLYLWLGAKQFAAWAGTKVDFIWLVAIGTTATFVVGYAASLLTKAPADAAARQH